jgi:hypothetical protein|nr:MAG TPA: endopeptidase tail [Caudoviricetes sp.]
MYRIVYGNEVIHDPRDPERILTDAKAELAVNEAGKLSFTVQQGHPMHGKLEPMNKDQEVVLEQDGIELFRGRILAIKEGFYGDNAVTCEGELSYMNDVTLRPYSTTESDVPSTVDGYFAWLVGEYGMKVEERHRFTVGINQGWELDPNNYILRENANRPNVAQEMKDKLLGSLGGYIRTRRSGDSRIIDYLSSGDRAASQRIEFGSNLLDFTREKDWADYFTVMIPIGAAPESQDGGSSEKIDISGEPDRELAGGLFKQGDRIIDNEAVRKYGYIERVVEFEDITIPKNLVESGARLMRNIRVGDVLTMTAVDLNMIDPDVKPILIGDFVRATSKPHGYDEYFVCSKLTVDVTNPSNNTFVLGNEYDYMTGKQSAKLSALNASINSVYEETAKLTEEAKQAAQEAKDAASTAVQEAYEEYALTSSRTTKPEDGAAWSKEPPSAGTGEFVWRRTVTKYGDGTTVAGEAVLLTGESVAAVEITTTNGTVIRNRKGSTTLQATVLYGGERITDLDTLESYFGIGACLQWSENDNGVFSEVSEEDPRLSEDGFRLTVSASDITGDASYLCDLKTTM